MTIPTTAKAITETPANTPKPIGNTSNFFPGGSKGAAAAPALSGVELGDTVGGGEPEDWGKGTVEGGGVVVVDRSGLSGCGLGSEPRSQTQAQRIEFWAIART